MKEIRILVSDPHVPDLLTAILPFATRIVIDDAPEPDTLAPERKPVTLARSLAVNRVSSRRFPPISPLDEAPIAPPLQGVPTPAPVPPGHTRVAAHYNGARYVPEHIRPNPVTHKRRRPPLAHSDPATRKTEIVALMARRWPEGIQPRDLKPLARTHHDNFRHWTNTLRGLVRYKHVVRTERPEGPVYLLPHAPKAPQDTKPRPRIRVRPLDLGNTPPDLNSRDDDQ